VPPAECIIPVACRDDILQVAARRIVSRCAATLPDLTDCVVLLPDMQFAPRLRRQLLQATGSQHPALLGPSILTTELWLREHLLLDREVPGRARLELMLVEALQQQPSVFAGIDPWHIASDMLGLFDELTLNRVHLPETLDDFSALLQRAYGISGAIPEPLGMEATIVHRLWEAWHEQLNARELCDPCMAYLQRLAAAAENDSDTVFFLVGPATLSLAELDWVNRLLQRGCVEVILQAPPHDSQRISQHPLQQLLAHSGAAAAPLPESTPLSRCLDAALLTSDPPPVERARDLRARLTTSPLAGTLAILPANSAEQEARAIDIQVRQWLLEGRHSIAVVTEDRRLARRVRALLERAGIALQDSGGWALSTTSAAAALERWLETVEEDFAHQPLLDVLKSPFVCPPQEREAHLASVHRLEQDIILHEQIARGLERYRRHLDYRSRRLDTSWTERSAEAVRILLNRLDQAADPLREFITGNGAPPARLLEGLRSSMEALGLWAAFGADPAGRRILDEWDLLYQAAAHSALTMDWLTFRAWLGAALERHDFHPASDASPVMLLTLQQAQLGRFDGLVLGACDREHLPGARAGSPFFNDGVRQELGLPAWPERYQQGLHRFRSLLESAPRILLTWCRESAGETRLPSPWLEALQTFHRLAYADDDLLAGELQALADNPLAQVRGANPLPLPVPAGHPAPVLAAALQPRRLSAGSHQRLIDCPYRFYAADALRLKPREAVSEALEKSDYGERIHRCLEAFHGGHKRLPGPFAQPLTAQNRAAAIAFLRDLSAAVFADDLEDNFEHRAWLKRWDDLIPDYIDWQIRHQAQWAVQQVEQQTETRLAGEDLLHGRLDRIDSGPDGLAVIDYKTGAVPKREQVETGEAVQLPSYALLTDSLPVQVGYLQLDRKVSDTLSIQGAALDELATAVRERLVTVLAAIRAGTPLPAWGDADVCRYCEMDGLCRQQAWLDDATTDGDADPA
jgi:ATP-dependent helicase/nuclease subunit B